MQSRDLVVLRRQLHEARVRAALKIHRRRQLLLLLLHAAARFTQLLRRRLNA
jgi:hypothetical protein